MMKIHVRYNRPVCTLLPILANFIEGGLREVLLHMAGKQVVFPLHCSLAVGIVLVLVIKVVGECQQGS